jgi:hypothetical protein
LIGSVAIGFKLQDASHEQILAVWKSPSLNFALELRPAVEGEAGWPGSHHNRPGSPERTWLNDLMSGCLPLLSIQIQGVSRLTPRIICNTAQPVATESSTRTIPDELLKLSAVVVMQGSAPMPATCSITRLRAPCFTRSTI